MGERGRGRGIYLGAFASAFVDSSRSALDASGRPGWKDRIITELDRKTNNCVVACSWTNNSSGQCLNVPVSLHRAEKTEVLSDDLLQVNTMLL